MAIPALEFVPRGRRAEPSPVHSDVAGFIGQTRRGPVGQAIRVEGWRRFERLFGGLQADLTLTYALRGYFANGGQVAYVVRVAGGAPQPAAAVWQVPVVVRCDAPQRYRIQASSPGTWGRSITVAWQWAPQAGRFVVTAPGERTEYLTGLDEQASVTDEAAGRGTTLEHRVFTDSDLIELVPLDETAGSGEAMTTSPIKLGLAEGDAESAPTLTDYLAAAQALGDEPEVAMITAPGCYEDLSEEDDRDELLLALLRQAVEQQDRLVLIDPPNGSANDMAAFAQDLRVNSKWDGVRRGGAIYGPWLRMSDPLGSVANPLRTLPASGHIAGVISRLDRERGAHHTPANVSLLEAVDLEQRFDRSDETTLNDAGINLIRCQPGRGLMVWGGRTVDPQPGVRFVAHRRLIHRLVRSIRKVAEPVVFDTNGPALWLGFARAVTTVLLEAFRAGALKGDRAEDAFRVQCDAQTNPDELLDLGQAVCLISLAPAVPMEFITLRVALSENKQVEVFDA